MFISSAAFSYRLNSLTNFSGFKSKQSIKPLVQSRERILPKLKEAIANKDAAKIATFTDQLKRIRGTIMACLRAERAAANSKSPSTRSHLSAAQAPDDPQATAEKLRACGILPVTA